MTNPAKDAERLAEYRLWHDTTKPGTPCYASIGFLLQQVDRLTQERDAAMESLLSSMRHNSIATGHGDSIADLIGEYNAWAIETRVLLQRTLVERDEARRSAEALKWAAQFVKYARHLSNCRYHGGHDCSCGADELRALAARDAAIRAREGEE